MRTQPNITLDSGSAQEVTAVHAVDNIFDLNKHGFRCCKLWQAVQLILWCLFSEAHLPDGRLQGAQGYLIEASMNKKSNEPGFFKQLPVSKFPSTEEDCH